MGNERAETNWDNDFISIFIYLGDPWVIIKMFMIVIFFAPPTFAFCFPCLIIWIHVYIGMVYVSKTVQQIEFWYNFQFAALYKTLTGVIHGFGRGGGGVAGSCPQLLNSKSFPSDEAVCLIQVQIDSENREVKTSGKPGSQKPVLTPISVTLQKINLNFREAQAKA